MTISERQHALLAEALISACGGLDEAAGTGLPSEVRRPCRVHRSSLSNYQTRNSGHFMPADVIADLEEYCGEPIYSRALFEARPASVGSRDVLDEACEAVEVVVDFQRKVRIASKDGQITPRERDEIARAGAEAAEQLREAVETAETFAGLPKGRNRTA